MWACQFREETAVVLEGARGDFDPAGTSLPEAAQVISLGQVKSAGIALSDCCGWLISYLRELRFRGRRREQADKNECGDSDEEGGKDGVAVGNNARE